MSGSEDQMKRAMRTSTFGNGTLLVAHRYRGRESGRISSYTPSTIERYSPASIPSFFVEIIRKLFSDRTVPTRGQKHRPADSTIDIVESPDGHDHGSSND